MQFCSMPTQKWVSRKKLSYFHVFHHGQKFQQKSHVNADMDQIILKILDSWIEI